MTVADIEQLLRGSAKQLADIVRQTASTLQGTILYWSKKSRELQAMIRQIGAPHAFITHSAADLHWPDLHQHTANPPRPTVDETTRIRNNWQNLNENPALTAWYFYRCWQLFFSTVVKPLFIISDWWFHLEWQSLGFSHVHGLAWIQDAPSIEALRGAEGQEGWEEFIAFWKDKAHAANLAQDHPPAELHPTSLSISNLTLKQDELAQLLNCVQCHTTHSNYCLQQLKGSRPDAPEHCQFSFPKQLLDEAEM